MRSCVKEALGEREKKRGDGFLFSCMHLSEGYPPDLERKSACVRLNLVYLLPEGRGCRCWIGSYFQGWNDWAGQRRPPSSSSLGRFAVPRRWRYRDATGDDDMKIQLKCRLTQNNYAYSSRGPSFNIPEPKSKEKRILKNMMEPIWHLLLCRLFNVLKLLSERGNRGVKTSQ